MIILRLVGLGFAVIEIALFLRLLLPYVEVPRAVRGYVPQLIQFTNILIAPLQSIVKPFDLATSFSNAGQAGGDALGTYASQLDPAVLVAMVVWGIIATFVIWVLGLVVRP